MDIPPLGLRWFGLAISAVMLSSCTSLGRSADQPSQPTSNQANDANQVNLFTRSGATAMASPLPDRPEITTKTIFLEGEPLELTLRLFTDDTVPFSTYLPVDELVPEVEVGSTQTTATFFANFGGELSPDAYVQVVIPKTPGGFLPDQAREPIIDQITGEAGLLAENAWQMLDYTDVVIYDWGTHHVQFRSVLPNETITGHIYVGQANEQEFYVLIHYPAEYAEGFDPRAEVVLDGLQFLERSTTAAAEF